MKVRATTTINKPVSDVFPLMADDRSEPRWNSNLSDSELLTAELIGVGSHFRAVPKGVMTVMLPLAAPLVRRDFPEQFANFKAFAEQR